MGFFSRWSGLDRLEAEIRWMIKHRDELAEENRQLKDWVQALRDENDALKLALETATNNTYPELHRRIAFQRRVLRSLLATRSGDGPRTREAMLRLANLLDLRP